MKSVSEIFAIVLLIQGQSIDIGKHHHNFTSLTYSERIAIDSTDDLA